MGTNGISSSKTAQPSYQYGSIAGQNATSNNNEVSKNLMPSPNSTDGPSRENLAKDETYQLIDGDEHQQRSSSEIQLQTFGRKATFEEVMHRHVTGRHVRVRTVACCVIAVAASIGLAARFSALHHRQESDGGDALSPYGPTKGPRAPFSRLDPVADLGIYDYARPKASTPARPITEGLKDAKTYPTNAWYQSLLMPGGEPESMHRAYAIPYVVDAAGPMPGLRVHPNHVDASSFVVQLYVIEEYGLTLGAAADAASTAPPKSDKKHGEAEEPSHQYKVTHVTPLGVTLDWNFFPMQSSITKGMPYATMRYQSIHQSSGGKAPSILPTVAAEVPLAGSPIVDGVNEIKCGPSSKAKTFVVKREVELFFKSSDFKWLVFVSEPVVMRCVLDDNEMMRLQVVGWNEDEDVDRELVVRVALSKKCSSGVNPIYCHQEQLHPTALMLGQGNYATQLRKHANFFPGPNTTFDYEFDDASTATMIFNWDVQDMSEIALHPVPANKTDLSLIAFALPHHFDIIQQVPPADHDIYCVATLTGPACLYEGPVWQLKEPIPAIGFRAPRPPAPWAIRSIAKSLKSDINYTLPDFYLRGAGDTYFSGKMLAKLGRILLISEEVEELCSSDGDPDYEEVCQGISLPSKSEFSDAVAALRSSVEVWINGTAETPFVFDSSWGGIVSCGCDFDGDTSTCKNKFPHCPGFGDPGLNFGNAFYNDVHFHYGYFIFASAVVAHFDPEWGRQMFERVLLLIRCIANPSEEDGAFPTWRHKDWYQGHSWASGIAVVFFNGKNQESSSESIAAYEAVALYGSAMVSAWEESGSRSNAKIAQEIEQAGQLLTATELRSARTYWHVTDDKKIKIYPSSYTPRAIGMLWQTMAQCQTWFGAAAYLAYGIQLLPLTPVSEYRDTLSWSKETYHKFAESCNSDPGCTSNGWSIIQLALLATVGHQQSGADIATALPADVFESAGGNGHSLTNTLWYLSTRPVVDKPLQLTKNETAAAAHAKANNTSARANEVTDCGKPDTCTDYVLDTIAGEYSCRQRMDWLIQQNGKTEKEACSQIARVENPNECGACDPEAEKADNAKSGPPKCPQCTPKQCRSDLNRCPLYHTTFVCTDGDSVGGCSNTPWNVPSQQCRECCELTHCRLPSAAELRAKNEAKCPPCSRKTCRGPVNQCPPSDALQYLCVEGLSEGGCSALPWVTKSAQCLTCCSVLPGCGK